MKRPSESMFPIGLGSKLIEFRVFKRIKTKNTYEESLEGINTEMYTTIMLSSELVFTLKQAKGTITDASASPSFGEQRIFLDSEK